MQTHVWDLAAHMRMFICTCCIFAYAVVFKQLLHDIIISPGWMMMDMIVLEGCLEQSNKVGIPQVD